MSVGISNAEIQKIFNDVNDGNLMKILLVFFPHIK